MLGDDVMIAVCFVMTSPQKLFCAVDLKRKEACCGA